MPEPNTGCWLWARACHKKSGYGVSSKNKLAHRVAYEFANGAIPKGMHIDHLCRQRSCVNPSHLEAVTPRENNARSASPSAINATKTHCGNGHAFSPTNTKMIDGARECRECRKATIKSYRQRHRDKYNAYQRDYYARTGRKVNG